MDSGGAALSRVESQESRACRREPSAMFVGTEVMARRNWEVTPNRSSCGKLALIR
jgi:hypothetical protein